MMQCVMIGRYNLPEGAIVVVSALGGPEDTSVAAAADVADAADSAALAAELADAAATEVSADAVRLVSDYIQKHSCLCKCQRFPRHVCVHE